MITVPLRGTHPLTPQEFAELPDTVRARYETAIEQLAPRMQAFVTGMRARQRDGRERLRALEREVAMFAISHPIEELTAQHAEEPWLVEWLGAVAEDVIGNLKAFQEGSEQALARYEVNVFVAHDTDDGAPVVLESNPSFPNLFGRIEPRGVLGGGLEADHRMLRAGATHRANGGYLMLPAAEVLASPLVWLKLKNVLRTGSVRLENPAEAYALIPTVTLNPERIPLDLKVVLVGNPALYELAYRLDEDVRKLFRVKVEFDWRMRWNRAGERAYAAFLSAQARSCSLLHFDAGAVARIVEHGGRLADSRDWLSTAYTEVARLSPRSPATGRRARAARS